MIDRGSYERVWGGRAEFKATCPECATEMHPDVGWDIHDQAPTVRGNWRRCSECKASMPRDQLDVAVVQRETKPMLDAAAAESEAAYRRSLEAQKEQRRRARAAAEEAKRNPPPEFKSKFATKNSGTSRVAVGLGALGAGSCALWIAVPVLVIVVFVLMVIFSL